ncbi:translocation/assembly module TamB domain-containing protein [Pyxidicoccus caerfyrddinensis]|uniref:translocation/assembly module TamB domain-containing protein n=1 Tax=Pyxidicoccus caerfyrddinensis TaxID=2709663 RepID=UPI001F07A748|nr:translocation/assembly module TamB domain-containing protein [Pyxidicoccus caerfyrddinensis]
MSDRKRWGRRLLWGLGGLVAVLVLAVVGALVFLTSSSGEAWLVRKGVALANEQLSGRLELGGLDLWPGGIILTDLKLYDPEGELVAEIARVEARLGLSQLVRQHVDLSLAKVERPRLYLAQDERGLNLSRALEPREPKPEEPSKGRGKLKLDVHELVLEDGYVDFRQEVEDGPERHVRLEDFDAKGTASYAAATQGFNATLEATGGLALPVSGPVRLSLKGGGEEGALQADLGLEAAGLVLDAGGNVKLPPEPPPGQPEGKLQGQVTVRRLVAPPAFLKGFVPTYPLLVPVSLEGTASMDGDLVNADARAQAADAKLELKGDLDLEHMKTRGFTAKARDVDLSQLVAEGPKTNVHADLAAKGGGTSLETLDGEVDLTISPSEYQGQPLGPVELEASAKNGQYTLSRLQVLLPGASLRAKGQGTQEKMRVDGGFTAGNLALLSQALTKLLPGTVAPMSGSGTLDFVVEGPLRTPGLEAHGSFASLAYGPDLALKDLSVKVELPDVTRPLDTDASVVVAQLRTGGRNFKDLAATVATRERKLDATVRVQGDAQLGLALGGMVDEDGQGLAVDALSLSWPEATWKLQRPSHVGFGGGRVEVEPALTLTSGPQSLSLRGAKEGEQVTARVELGAFDLTTLPRAFVPESLGLGGTVTGHVAARGRLPRPDAEANLRWEDGRVQGYEGLQASVNARYVKDRATGKLAANLPVAKLTADFDVPVQGVLKRRRDPMSLKVNLEDLDVAGVMKLVKQPEGPSGHLSGTLAVVGPAREPKLDFVLRGKDMRYQVPPPGFSLKDPLAFELTAASDAQDGTLDARLNLEGLASQAYVALRTPFTLGGLMAKPPTPEEALSAALELEARVADLPLKLLEGMPGVDRPDGKVSAQVDIKGSVLVPQGRLAVQVAGATANGVPPQNGQLTVTGGEKDVKVTLAVQRQEGPLAQLEATLLAPLGALQDREVYGRIPFRIRGRLMPVAIQELPGLARARTSGPPPTPGTNPQGLQGVLAMEVAARGTLDTPEVDLTAGVQKLGVGALGLGQARLHYTYKGIHSAFDAMLTAPAGGTMLVTGGVDLDVSLPAFEKGLQYTRAPLEVSLKARNFDPSFLSGATEMVRSLGGLVQADAKLAGTVGAPTFQGTLAWKDGVLGLMGLGEYREIQLALEASQESIALRTLSAKAGNGSLRLEAPLTAVRTRAGEYELSSPKGNEHPLVTQDFPIIFDDQLMALVSLRAKVEGTLSERLVNLRNVSIPEATITLPELKRKDLQPLERPGDVVLVRNGVPVERKKRKKQQQASPGTPGAAGMAEKDKEENIPDATPSDRKRTAVGGSGVGAQAEDLAKAVDEAGEDEDVGTPQEAPLRTYWVNVNAPRNVWVKGSDVNVELGLSEDFRVEYREEARLFGEVRVLRGRVDVLGRRFDVQRDSQVRFTGPATVPYINVTAEHRNDSAKVTVFVTIRGQGRELTLKPTSDPPLPESEIYTLLATGRRTLERGSGASMTASAQAASVVGSLVANEARKALAAKLPLDVLSIEAGDSGLAGTKLEVGTYVTDKIYVGYTGRVGANLQQGENANAVRFEYQLGTRWSLEGQYGDARSGGLDLIWSKEY